MPQQSSGVAPEERKIGAVGAAAGIGAFVAVVIVFITAVAFVGGS